MNLLKLYRRRNAALLKVIADLREGLEERDAEIRELQDENAVLRRKRARLADEFATYKRHSVYMPHIGG